MRHRARGLNDLRTTREIIQLKQVCVQRPSAAAVNATLLALLLTAVQQSIDIRCPPSPVANPPHAAAVRSIAGTDRRTPYHNTDPAGCRTQCEQCQ